MPGAWEELERRAPASVRVDGHDVGPGSRVRLRPGPRGDVFDIVLGGLTAVVESVEEDTEGNLTLAVVIEDDPGGDLGFARQPGHRFFFAPHEVESLPGEEPGPPVSAAGGSPAPAAPAAPGTGRILVAGIGNVFLGDDGFGVVLAERLWERELPPGVEVVDYGIRGMDLAFAMQDGYESVVLLDASPRGGVPGTLYVIDADSEELGEVAVDGHGMDPVSVLGLVRTFGGVPPRTYVVACEPLTRMSAEDEEIVAELSEPVRAALDRAVELVEALLEQIAQGKRTTGGA